MIPDGQPEITYYEYDNHGNLINSIQSVFDDKLSYISTNPVSSVHSPGIIVKTIQRVQLIILLPDCPQDSAEYIPAPLDFLIGDILKQ